MDTGTHIAMGVALGSLATMDPAISQDPTLVQTIFAGTIIGSHAPDFDTIFKFKNNASYIRSHRGFSHSMPMVLFWGALISLALYVFSPSISFWHLFVCSTLAVYLFIFVYLFYSYVYQILLTFFDKCL